MERGGGQAKHHILEIEDGWMQDHPGTLTPSSADGVKALALADGRSRASRRYAVSGLQSVRFVLLLPFHA